MMSLHINTHYAKKRGIAKNVLFAVRTVMCQEQVDMVAGDFNGATWRKKSGDNQQRHSTIEEAFANTNQPIPHGSSPLWGVQETFQRNGPTYVVSLSHRIQTMSGRYAVTARLKSIAIFSAFDPPTRAAATRFGSTFHTPTLGWSTNTVLATMSAACKTGGRARQDTIHTTTCDHSLCARKMVIHMTTKSNAAIRAENASIDGMLEDKYPGVRRVNSMRLAICSAALVRVFVARLSLQRVLSCLVTRPHPLIARACLS